MKTKLTDIQKEVLEAAIYENVRKLLHGKLIPEKVYESGSIEDLNNSLDKAANRCTRNVMWDIQQEL